MTKVLSELPGSAMIHRPLFLNIAVSLIKHHVEILLCLFFFFFLYIYPIVRLTSSAANISISST